MSSYYGLEPVCYPAEINHIRSQTMKYIVVVKKTITYIKTDVAMSYGLEDYFHERLRKNFL